MHVCPIHTCDPSEFPIDILEDYRRCGILDVDDDGLSVCHPRISPTRSAAIIWATPMRSVVFGSNA
jgi:hypothetical protein